jgi:glutamate/tyrosine decarboxylase-like PLP-dependent enzyme
MAIKTHGLDGFRAVIEKGADDALLLARLVRASSDFELVMPVSLNVVCFRFLGASGANVEETNRLNAALIHELRFRSIAMVSRETLNGKVVMRACFNNHRTKDGDLMGLLDQARAIAAQLG